MKECDSLKVIPIRPELVPGEGWRPADPGPFRFAPALCFLGVRVPAAELVEHLQQRAIQAGKMPADQLAHWWELHIDGSRTRAGYVAFPMTAENFSRYGFLLSEWLHTLAWERIGGDSYFLTDYTRLGGVPYRPADDVRATLFYVRGGQWRDAVYDRIDREG